MTTPAPDPRLVTLLLSEHYVVRPAVLNALQSAIEDAAEIEDGEDSWEYLHDALREFMDAAFYSGREDSAAEVEAHVQERIAEALDAAADEATCGTDFVMLDQRAAAHRPEGGNDAQA